MGQKVLTRDDREAIFKGWERGARAFHKNRINVQDDQKPDLTRNDIQ